MATRGTGRYKSGGKYIVINNKHNRLYILEAGLVVGSGDCARTFVWENNKLVLPERGNLPQLVLENNMYGLWETDGDLGGQVYQTISPIVVAGIGTFRIIGAEGPTLIFVDTKSGLAYIPGSDAPEQTTERKLADLLTSPEGPQLTATWLEQAEVTAKDVGYHPSAGQAIELDGATNMWMAVSGAERQVLTDYQHGDKTINLLRMITDGTAVPIGLNWYEGEPVEVIGITKLSNVGYNGRENDQFKFVVPCPEGVTRTLHVVVKHEIGYAVYGFTIAHRTRVDLYKRRPIRYAGDAKRYIVFPRAERLVVF